MIPPAKAMIVWSTRPSSGSETSVWRSVRVMNRASAAESRPMRRISPQSQA
jgi:hypothetical protein